MVAILSFLWFFILSIAEGMPQAKLPLDPIFEDIKELFPALTDSKVKTERNQCKDFLDFGYFCVPFYQCDEESLIRIDGSTLIDPRIGDVDCDEAPSAAVATTSECSKKVERCCLHPHATDICSGRPPTRTPTRPPTIKPTFKPTSNIKPNNKCGKRNENGVVGVRTVLDVDDAEFGEWPHVCAVLVKKVEQGTELKVYLCGGSLIEDGVILTAAHCLNDVTPADLIVRCGEWDTLSEDPLPFQEIGVDSMQIHPCFNNDNLHHDVALLLMVQHFTLTAHISPVCLPSPGTEWPGGQPCVSNGWGKDKFGAEGKYANILKEVRVPLVGNQECQNLMRKNTRLGPFFELDESFLCAGGQKGVDTCKGDGGSPLVCEQSGGVFVQAGIVSWGIGCGGVGTPAIYAHVAKAACWIDSQVRCFYGDENSRSSFGYRDSQCPKIRCGDLNRTECGQKLDLQ